MGVLQGVIPGVFDVPVAAAENKASPDIMFDANQFSKEMAYNLAYINDKTRTNQNSVAGTYKFKVVMGPYPPTSNPDNIAIRYHTVIIKHDCRLETITVPTVNDIEWKFSVEPASAPVQTVDAIISSEPVNCPVTESILFLEVSRN